MIISRKADKIGFIDYLYFGPVGITINMLI